VGKKSELKTMVSAGVHYRANRSSKGVYKWLQISDIINHNKGKELDYTVPEGIITVVLEDSD
jgi:hypothetical protein